MYTAMEEQFLFAGQFDGKRLLLSPLSEAKAHIAYFKLRSITKDEFELYRSANEGATGKRTVYNNDGFSDFFSGAVPNADKLEELAVESIAGKDVGQVVGSCWLRLR